MHIPFFVLPLVALLVLAPAAGAAELEIEKESDGIHIIQKNPPPLSKPQQKQDTQAPDAEGQPESQGQAEDAAPGQEQVQKDVPLEENPDFVQAMNQLTSEYNRRLTNLQQEADRLQTAHNRRRDRLRDQVLTMEQAMSQAEEQYNRERFFQYRDRRLLLQRRIDEADEEWQDTRDELQKRQREIRNWYADRQRELRQQFSKKQ